MGSQNTPLVAVLGAGVIGLQTAVNILEAGYSVKLIAKQWPGDQDFGYTSMWAGAQWRSTSKMHETHMQEWEQQTFEHWQKLTAKHPSSSTGIANKPGMYYWDTHSSQGRTPEQWLWWAKLIPEYRYLSRAEIPVPEGDNERENDTHKIEGITYQSFSIAPEKYLQYLMRTYKGLGGTTIHAEVTSLDQIFTLPGCEYALGVVNCSGIAGKNLVDDAHLYATKGQAVVVRGEAHRISTGLGKDWEAVVVPRDGLNETFLGVTKIYGDDSLDIDDNATQMILDQAKPLAPELLDAHGNFEVLRVQVGLRPTRTGGARVALENLPGSQEKWVCHNYGHHGAGYEESFGCAQTVVQLIRQRLTSTGQDI